MLEPPIRKLLLVEDDEQGVIPAELFFDQESWQEETAPPNLLVARSGSEFRQLLQEHRDVEAIVTDIILTDDPTAGGENGIALYAELAHLAPEVPCFAITGQAPDSVAIEAVRAGVVDYVKKPFSWRELWGKIQTKVAVARAASARRQLEQAVTGIVNVLQELESARRPTLSVQLLRKIVEVAVLATEASGGWLFLSQAGQLEFQLAVGVADLKETPDQGLFRSVFSTGREECLYLTGEEEAGFLADFEREQSALLVVPLTSDSEVLGSLVLGRSLGSEPFTPAQVGLMNQFSDLGGATLEAHLRDLDSGALISRGLAWAVSQSADGADHLERLKEQALALPSAEQNPIWEELHRLQALGEPHLDFWLESLRLYLERFSRV